MKNYLLLLEKEFRKVASPERAQPMKRYMKNHFEFFGIPSPQRKEIEGKFIIENGNPSAAELPALIREAYRKPQREFQYFIIGLTVRYVKKELQKDFINTVHFMIVTKSWWDSVDWIAAWLAGGLVMKYPELTSVMDEWADSGNRWLQHAAILHQLRFKNETDERRLFEYCRKHASSSEFFIRKAIGWALRQYSGVSPAAVQQFVKQTELSPLSRREALRKTAG